MAKMVKGGFDTEQDEDLLIGDAYLRAEQSSERGAKITAQLGRTWLHGQAVRDRTLRAINALLTLEGKAEIKFRPGAHLVHEPRTTEEKRTQRARYLEVLRHERSKNPEYEDVIDQIRTWSEAPQRPMNMNVPTSSGTQRSALAVIVAEGLEARFPVDGSFETGRR